MSKKMRKFVKPVGTRLDLMYGNCKVHKQQVGGFPPFWSTLSTLQTPTYNLAKFLIFILNPLTKNQYTVRYNKLRYKIWGTYRCVTSYWKEGQSIKKQ